MTTAEIQTHQSAENVDKSQECTKDMVGRQQQQINL